MQQDLQQYSSVPSARTHCQSRYSSKPGLSSDGPVVLGIFQVFRPWRVGALRWTLGTSYCTHRQVIETSALHSLTVETPVMSVMQYKLCPITGRSRRAMIMGRVQVVYGREPH